MLTLIRQKRDAFIITEGVSSYSNAGRSFAGPSATNDILSALTTGNFLPAML